MELLKSDTEINLSSFRDFYKAFQSLATANWNADCPRVVIALGTVYRMTLINRLS